jgi:hypothetical protein
VNPFEFVLIIIAMVFGFALLKHRLGIRDDGEQPVLNDGETLRLREEVKELKERIKVLERITVEKENSLARQIDDLRDR